MNLATTNNTELQLHNQNEDKGPPSRPDTLTDLSPIAMVDSDKIEVGAGDDYLELGQRPAGSAGMTPEDRDPFGNEGGNDIKFKTMTWW
ncbi:uncharacterized protein H6S33_008730 [Morchella sextelata]|uniref:uncharacterized protein n=1 Tax=Morchella sextelata TaxID=1174677 RepID=UPI001D048097|nr:uncharacterized protein H6S33_008730 [Morchella sextelata]KAH0602391.1 hypothetical protein H6S33_008730 [Morchella sextelata]